MINLFKSFLAMINGSCGLLHYEYWSAFRFDRRNLISKMNGRYIIAKFVNKSNGRIKAEKRTGATNCMTFNKHHHHMAHLLNRGAILRQRPIWFFQRKFSLARGQTFGWIGRGREKNRQTHSCSSLSCCYCCWLMKPKERFLWSVEIDLFSEVSCVLGFEQNATVAWWRPHFISFR